MRMRNVLGTRQTRKNGGNMAKKRAERVQQKHDH